MNYPTYSEYKESGVQWLGQVPGHWEVWKLSHGFQSTGSGTTPPSDNDAWYDGDIPWVTTSELRESIIFDTTKKVSEDAIATFSALKLFPKGSLAIAMYGATIGRLGILGVPATTNQACCVMYGERALNARFMFLWFQAFREQVVLLSSGGGQPNISQDKIRSIRVACPPCPEQTAIADFLDRETGRIDALVAKKRRLIALLKEKRTALISRTVTRGLPADAAREFGLEPHTRFKDSGIEWLGQVPEGWEIVPLGFLVTLKGGATPDKSNSEYWEGSIPWVSPKDMKVARLCDSQDHVSEDALRNSALVLLPERAVLIVVRGMILAHSFPVALTTGSVTINQDMKALICGSRLSPQYLVWLLTGFSNIFVTLADESAHGTKKLETATLTSFPVLLANLPEQTAIATYLDRETAKIDKLEDKVDAAIARLQEYRTALITAAVTGKIDVRNQETIRGVRHASAALP